MPIFILTVTKSNGDVITIGHQVSDQSLSLYKDVIKSYSAIFQHYRQDEKLPDEVFTREKYLVKEKEFLNLLHNIHKKVIGCHEILLLDTMTIDLTIPIKEEEKQ